MQNSIEMRCMMLHQCCHADLVWQLLQGGMELRVLHAAAHKSTWYGQWGYQYGRGAFNITQNK